MLSVGTSAPAAAAQSGGVEGGCTMATMIPYRVTAFLDAQQVPYDVIHHRRDYAAQWTAADTHTKGREFAKVIVFATPDGYAFAVVPAHRHVDLDKIRSALGVPDVRLAAEDEIEQLFPDCEVGAEPPLGNLYGMPVYLSAEMTEDEQITFNAGTHEDALRVPMRDFDRIVRPR